MGLKQQAAQARWRRQVLWRGALLGAVFAAGLLAFLLGAQVSDRDVQANATLWSAIYYTLGLFVLGGLDLGTPSGGPPLAQALLWFSYFAAPAITTSALLEALARLMQDRRWLRGTPRNHIVIAGCGRTALTYLRLLRAREPDARVLVVDHNPEAPTVEQARELYGAEVITGDMGDELILDQLNLTYARRIFLMAGDNFANLDAFTRILNREPLLAPRLTLHLSDLEMHRLLEHHRLLGQARRFNAHQIAAQELVRQQLLAHFHATTPRDVVVLAGFGRFGQTVLCELQAQAAGHFGEVVVMDTHARVNALVFKQQVGQRDSYKLHTLHGDLRDPGAWEQVADLVDLEHTHPVFVVGSGHDYTNLRTAIWLRSRYPKAYIVVRVYQASPFAEMICAQQDLHLVGIGDMMEAVIEGTWFRSV
jgi:Trk K+ transport system NAD-binding subunit